MIRILLFCLILHVPFAQYAQEQTKSGLLIDNGFRRGTSFTDSMGISYYVRDIPVSITNDSTIPIQLEIVFDREYRYPAIYRDEMFQVFPLPRESAYDDIQIYREQPFLQLTVEPGEELLIGIASLYPKPPEDSGVLPQVLFELNKEEVFPECDWPRKGGSYSSQKIPLGLKLVFTDACMIIPCGYISYPD